ncbi:MAG TPA: DUF5691 domain-containing protein [Ktedonobacterales bacterium]
MTATRPNSLTAQALAGLAHSPNASPTTGAPVDGIPLPGEDAGRDLLLRAAESAIYHAAGRLPARGVAPLEAAKTEERPICPPDAAALIEGLVVTGRDDLLLEACARMERRGELLPPTLLPLTLKKARAFATNELRAALGPLAGERGRWLASHNPEWSWLLERTLPGVRDALPPDAETIWQEGTTRQRIALLGRLRTQDPALARDWLEGVWKKEKAETRASMLETFATGLAPDDEPLLEAALDDRGERVRAVAARLLTDLPASALALRLRDRANAAITFDGAALDADPPAAIDGSWARDGLPTQSISNKNGQRAFWLAALLERVPPAHWTERFGVAPAALIAASAASKWRASILESWSTATTSFQARDWALALWDALLAMPDKEIAQMDADRASYCRPLAPLLPPATLDAFVLRVLAAPDTYADMGLRAALDLLPRPWSVAVAQAYLDGLRAFAVVTDTKARATDPWDTTLNDAALAMPETAFTVAREPIAVPEAQNPYSSRFKNQLNAFAETIRLRERLVKVLPL